MPPGAQAMSAIKGHYNGSVVVLDEPAPTNTPVEVIVQFPDAYEAGRKADGADPETTAARIRHWDEARARLAHVGTTVSDEIIRQRDMD